MKTQLFLDSLKLSLSSFEAQTTKLLTTSAPLSRKMEDLTLGLLGLRISLVKSIVGWIRQTGQGDRDKERVLGVLEGEYQECCGNFRKLELHCLLKKKIRRLQRQSILNQTTPAHEHSLNSSTLQDPLLTKLKSSMLLIEKDLGLEPLIEDEPNTSHNYGYSNSHGYGYGDVSSVVHRSMASLEMTPIRTDRSQVGSQRDVSVRLDDSCVMVENQRANGEKEVKIGKEEKKQKVENYQEPKTEVKTAIVKPVQKKKKVVANSQNSMPKSNMFGNLLEQSLESCFSRQQKS